MYSQHILRSVSQVVPDTQSFPPAVQFFSPMDFSVRVTGELICFLSFAYSLAVSLFVCRFLCLPQLISVYLVLVSLCLSACLSLCLPVSLSPQFMSVCCLFFFFLFCRSLSVSLSVCLSASLSPSVYVGLSVTGFSVVVALS